MLLLESRITHYFKIIDAKDEDIELSVYDDFKRIEEIKNYYALKNWKPFSYNWKNYYPLVLEFINTNQNFSQYQNLSLNYYGKLLGHLTFIEECEKEHPSLINDCLKTNGRYKELFKNRINFYK